LDLQPHEYCRLCDGIAQAVAGNVDYLARQPHEPGNPRGRHAHVAQTTFSRTNLKNAAIDTVQKLRTQHYGLPAKPGQPMPGVLCDVIRSERAFFDVEVYAQVLRLAEIFVAFPWEPKTVSSIPFGRWAAHTLIPEANQRGLEKLGSGARPLAAAEVEHAWNELVELAHTGPEAWTKLSERALNHIDRRIRWGSLNRGDNREVTGESLVGGGDVYGPLEEMVIARLDIEGRSDKIGIADVRATVVDVLTTIAQAHPQIGVLPGMDRAADPSGEATFDYKALAKHVDKLVRTTPELVAVCYRIKRCLTPPDFEVNFDLGS
jgi:hypothetical protein